MLLAAAHNTSQTDLNINESIIRLKKIELSYSDVQ